MNHVKTNSQKTRERVLLAILIAITIVIAVVQQFANGMKRHAPTGRKLKIREIVGMICAPLLNTVLFLSLLALLFSGVTLTIGGSSYDIIRNIVLPAISINFVIEIITCSVVGIAICAALKQYTASAKRSV